MPNFPFSLDSKSNAFSWQSLIQNTSCWNKFPGYKLPNWMKHKMFFLIFFSLISGFEVARQEALTKFFISLYLIYFFVCLFFFPISSLVFSIMCLIEEADSVFQKNTAWYLVRLTAVKSLSSHSVCSYRANFVVKWR